MGYYVSLREAEWLIPTENLDKAYEVMCDLNKDDSLKSGGSSTGEKWFAWMPADYPSECKDAQSILVALGFEVKLSDDGLHITGYENKTGDESHFIEAIAPFSQNDSYMVWQGEEGDMWRWELQLMFGAGDNAYNKLVPKEAMIVWK